MSQTSVFSEVLLSDWQLVQQKSMVDVQEIKHRLQGMAWNRNYSHLGDLMSGTEANKKLLQTNRCSPFDQLTWSTAVHYIAKNVKVLGILAQSEWHIDKWPTSWLSES